jgi:hypothetical protein
MRSSSTHIRDAEFHELDPKFAQNGLNLAILAQISSNFEQFRLISEILR